MALPGPPPAAAPPVAPPAPPPAPPPAGSIVAATLAEFDTALNTEKGELITKLKSLQQDYSCKTKWWSFCKVHAGGNTDFKHHDLAFFMTFFESYEAGTIADDPSGGS